MLVTYKINLDRLNVGRSILKEVQLFESVWSDGSSRFLWLNLYFLMICNMLATHSLLFLASTMYWL
jgi:hypothetical protein